MPWRRTRDPYAIWVAETMLQQTQVNTVAPYYERFLTTFPTVEALARAPLPKVLALWSGLGYYRRAENLKKSAALLARFHDGQLPRDYAGLMALPGVGDYTAGAVLSIAFGQSYPALDGNARRVLGRIFAPQDEKELRALAHRLVPRARPGYFNQGLMELGATICIPQNPRCEHCPVVSSCTARAANTAPPAQLRSKAGKIFRSVTWPLAIIRHKGKLLLRRRPATGILRGLWELPGGEKVSGESFDGFFSRHLPALGRRCPPPRRIGEIQHSITTRRIRAPLYLVDLPAGAPLRLSRRHWRWLAPPRLGRYPVSSMTLKAAELLSADAKNPR